MVIRGLGAFGGEGGRDRPGLSVDPRSSAHRGDRPGEVADPFVELVERPVERLRAATDRVGDRPVQRRAPRRAARPPGRGRTRRRPGPGRVTDLVVAAGRAASRSRPRRRAASTASGWTSIGRRGAGGARGRPVRARHRAAASWERAELAVQTNSTSSAGVRGGACSDARAPAAGARSDGARRPGTPCARRPRGLEDVEVEGDEVGPDPDEAGELGRGAVRELQGVDDREPVRFAQGVVDRGAAAEGRAATADGPARAGVAASGRVNSRLAQRPWSYRSRRRGARRRYRRCLTSPSPEGAHRGRAPPARRPRARADDPGGGVRGRRARRRSSRRPSSAPTPSRSPRTGAADGGTHAAGGPARRARLAAAQRPPSPARPTRRR
jgi:hypothetical protein